MVKKGYISALKPLRLFSDLLLMAGAGAESTLETQKMCDKMAEAGADCFLIVTPFFYKNAMDNDALVKHFTKVSQVLFLCYQ